MVKGSQASFNFNLQWDIFNKKNCISKEIILWIFMSLQKEILGLKTWNVFLLWHFFFNHWYTILYCFHIYNTVVQQSPILLSPHPKYCSYYLSIQEDAITESFTIFSILYYYPHDQLILWLVIMCPFVFLTFPTQTPPTPSPW